MDSPIDVSVVIVSYNTRELLEQCLRSVAEAAGSVAVETFVVDNASVDGSANLVEAQFPQVKLIRNAKNVGFATANNQGVREARGRYVLLLNPDTIVLDGAIAATVAFMDGQPDAGIATCKVLNADHSFQTCYAEAFPGIFSIVTGGSSLRTAVTSLFMSRKYLASSGFGRRDIEQSHPVAWVMGAFMMIRRAVIEQVGLLDENLFMYGEEPDYCFRAKQEGWQMWYAPVGRIIHLGGQSTKAIDQARLTNWLLTTSFYFYRKHKGKAYTLACYFFVFTSSILKLLLYSALLWIPAGEAKVVRRLEKRQQMTHALRWCFRHNPLDLLQMATT